MTVKFPPAPRQIALMQPASKTLYDYWNALRNGRLMPSRREVDPAGLRHVLPHILLIERIDPHQTIFRLAGTGICRAFGRELRDHPFVSIWDGRHHYGVTTALDEALPGGRVALLHLRGRDLNRQGVSGEMILLPLHDAAGRARRAIGSLTFGPRTDMHSDKPFTRLELLDVVLANPARDRVALLEQPRAGSPPPALHVVPPIAPALQGSAAEHPSLARPWGRLIREMMGND